MKSATIHIETPLIESVTLSKLISRPVWLKMEALQPCGSFKARGIGLACQRSYEKGSKKFITSSGGNAGLAVAYSGRRLGVSVTVVVPESTSQRAQHLLQNESAEVIIKGQSWQEAHQHALSLMNKEAAYIHPFDDPVIWEGHASLIAEVVAAGLRPAAIVLSVGGGGLLCGVAEGLKQNGLAQIPIFTSETLGADSFYQSVQCGELIELKEISSIATTLGAKRVAQQALAVSQKFKVFPHVVTDRQAIAACLSFADDHRIVVEPACGASLALVYERLPELQKMDNILVIVCGGVGVTYRDLVNLREQAH